jgi:hypothetical protein
MISMNETSAVDFPRTETVDDWRGLPREFAVELHTMDGGFNLRAQETEPQAVIYEFAAYAEDSPALAIARLRDKIREGLSTRHSALEDWRRPHGLRTAAGKIGFDCVVLNGETTPLAEFGTILRSYVGWHFSIEIHDGYDGV